ncbi:LysE family translocator [Allorhizobium sonneratiae]|uniref:LysE family translocator n=1 Tax=Allorhizobium sonneratiae TaxID=2934936 RepID=UPI0020341F91|nr:LysE family translocator [Allorhizobium sonneratiae]
MTPGTGALFTIATGLARGKPGAVVAAFGCTMGIVPHMLAAMAGLAFVLAANPALFHLLKLIGALYLVYMAMLMWKGRTQMQSADIPERTARQTIVHAVLINLLNPKLSIFFLALLPQAIQPNDPDTMVKMMENSLVFMLMTFIVFTLYGLIAAQLRTKIMTNNQFMIKIKTTFALSFLFLGIRLATT